MYHWATNRGIQDNNIIPRQYVMRMLSGLPAGTFTQAATTPDRNHKNAYCISSRIACSSMANIYLGYIIVFHSRKQYSSKIVADSQHCLRQTISLHHRKASRNEPSYMMWQPQCALLPAVPLAPSAGICTAGSPQGPVS